MLVDQPVVVVRGEAVHEVPPDEATFQVTVSAADRDRPLVVRRLTERSAGIDTLLDSYDQAGLRRETSGMNVYPEFRRGEKVTRYHGQISTTVTVTDFAILGELMTRLAGDGLVSLSGPWWRLRPGSPAGAAVRRAAIGDALSRARDYAAAVGARLDRLVEISDTDGGGGAVYAARSMQVTNLSGGAADGAEPALDVTPQLQTLSAQVLLRALITNPESLG
ncbi:hypothetical protein ADL15_29830 [Actinoplanes awajinensis subsp. mycoplanecinus]|uniref:SIMPL domain-containing protein n=1 Tax=Actinoplanes awajinensis subsp. mycoplanecinus TaxID=135947 RepID=A0A101JLI1_9ACTN|nr:SIMPL domain-containing protein [Actinoplanes awajinensis]KUL29083.1 hypothetical protein ADL15_29830 [Actinoplanes awajinensis subsp. mycoplanecinus]